MRRKIVAILAADVAGYSRLVAQAEEDTLARFGEYRLVFDEVVARHGGRIFNTAGDAVMCAFESAVEALRAAIAIQEALASRNAALPASRRLQFRIGLTIGDVVERGTDLLGDGVNIAARLEGLAPPGGICLSRSVHEAVANKVAAPFRDLGPRALKNIPTPVHVFVIDGPGGAAGDTPAVRVRQKWRAWPSLAGAGAAVAGVAVAILAVSPEPSAVAPPAPAQNPAAPSPALPAKAPLPPRPPERAALPADPAAAFATLVREGNSVPDPKTGPEHYHNARLQEERGDPAAARRSYHAAVLLAHDAIDPGLRYSALLHAQDGRAAAHDIFAGLLREKPSRPLALLQALQAEGAERRSAMEAFAREHPDYAPVHYLLAQEYGGDRGDAQTIAERRKELDALRAFLKAESEGKLAPFILDASLAQTWLDRARQRRAALDSFFASHPTAPSARFSRDRAGWTVAVTLPEAATAIAYRVGDSGEFQNTGLLPTPDPRTGKPAPKTEFALPQDQPATTLHLTYTDLDGRQAGPFPIAFEPRQVLVSAQRSALEGMSWVSLRAKPRPALSIAPLIDHRCAIAKALVALDEGPLDNELPLPPCDANDPFAAPPDLKSVFTVPEDTQAVSVQLFYADGTVSDVKTFSRE